MNVLRGNSEGADSNNASSLFSAGNKTTLHLSSLNFISQIFLMSSSLLNRITINAEIAHCKPTIRNKRYTVEGMLEYMAGGDSIDDLLEEFPDL